jgi:dienelactone hydrolase
MQGGIKAAGISGKYAAIGYCFGGTGVLELARINIKGMVGAVSFHGGLKPLTPAPKKMNANVIVMHGLDDPFIPAADFNAISAEMNKAKSFKLFAFSGAVHAFTVKSMGFKVDGAKYDAEADKLSWKELVKALKSWSK